MRESSCENLRPKLMSRRPQRPSRSYQWRHRESQSTFKPEKTGGLIALWIAVVLGWATYQFFC
jgi:hypothetical protein